jgi:hypothetical protein
MMKGRINTVLLHDLEEFDDNLARWSDQDLSLACLFSIVLIVRKKTDVDIRCC